jgi:hypothetical protein
MTGWINSDDYVRSPETFGILPLSQASRETLNMQPYLDEFARLEKIHHTDLARLQQTCVAILPIHTSSERSLFGTLLSQKGSSLMSRTQPNWVAFACEWSKHVNGKTIFYKVWFLL